MKRPLPTLSPRRAGLLLALLQGGLLLSLGAAMLADRARLPRAWVRNAPHDPDLPIRGRYVSLQLLVPLRPVGAATALPAAGTLTPVELVVRRNRLEALAAATVPAEGVGQGLRQAWIEPVDGTPMARLDAPVAFFIPPDVEDPSRRPAGEQLWVEVTLPPDGTPRPIRLGLLRPGRAEIVPLRWRRPHG